MPGIYPLTVWTSNTADGSALASSTNEAIISPATDFTIPQNTLAVGNMFTICAGGKFSTTATPTLTFTLRYGGLAGTSLAASAAITTPSGAANLTWQLNAQLNIRTTGASGTVMTVGSVAGVSAATTLNLIPATTPATATIDTTTNTSTLVLTAKWSASSASNTIICNQWVITGSV